jgi:dolichol kinase
MMGYVGLGILIVVLPSIIATALLCALAALSVAAEVYRLWPGSTLDAWVQRAFGDVVKPFERRRLSAPAWSSVGFAALIVTCLLVHLPKNMVALASCVLAFSDPAAGVCRKAVNRSKIRFARRAIGSMAFFFAAISVLYAATWAFPIIFEAAAAGGPSIALAGLAASVAELLSVKHVDDNGVVPAVTVTALAAAGQYSRTQMCAVGAVLLLLVLTMWLVNARLTALLSTAREERRTCNG